jgi:hypothetical protein
MSADRGDHVQRLPGGPHVVRAEDPRAEPRPDSGHRQRAGEPVLDRRAERLANEVLA